jgi:hypothetical protein
MINGPRITRASQVKTISSYNPRHMGKSCDLGEIDNGEFEIEKYGRILSLPSTLQMMRKDDMSA